MSWTRWSRRTASTKDSSQYLCPVEKQPPSGKARRSISSLLFKSPKKDLPISAIPTRNINNTSGSILASGTAQSLLVLGQDAKLPHLTTSDIRVIHDFHDQSLHRLTTSHSSEDEYEIDHITPEMLLHSSKSLPPNSTRSSTFPSSDVTPEFHHRSLGRSASSTALRSKAVPISRKRPGTAHPASRDGTFLILPPPPPRRRTSSIPDTVALVKEAPPPPPPRMMTEYALSTDQLDWVTVDVPESPTFTARLKRTTSAQGLRMPSEDNSPPRLQRPRKQRSFHHPLPSPGFFKASASVPSSPIAPESPTYDPRRNTFQQPRKRLFSAASSIREKCERTPSSSQGHDDESLPKASFSTAGSSDVVSFSNPFPSYPSLPTPPSPSSSEYYHPGKIISTEQLNLIEARIQNEAGDRLTVVDETDASPITPTSSRRSARHSMIISSTTTLTPSPRRPSMRPSTSQGALGGSSSSSPFSQSESPFGGSPGLTLPPRHRARPGALVSEHPDIDTSLILSSSSPTPVHRKPKELDDNDPFPLLLRRGGPRRSSFFDISEDPRRSAASNFLDLDPGRDSLDLAPVTHVISPLPTPPL